MMGKEVEDALLTPKIIVFCLINKLLSKKCGLALISASLSISSL